MANCAGAGWRPQSGRLRAAGARSCARGNLDAETSSA